MFVDENLYKYLLGFLNTPIVQELTKILNPTVNLCVTDMLNVPLIISKENFENIGVTVDECYGYAKFDWDSFETSWAKNAKYEYCHYFSNSENMLLRP